MSSPDSQNEREADLYRPEMSPTHAATANAGRLQPPTDESKTTNDKRGFTKSASHPNYVTCALAAEVIEAVFLEKERQKTEEAKQTGRELPRRRSYMVTPLYKLKTAVILGASTSATEIEKIKSQGALEGEIRIKASDLFSDLEAGAIASTIYQLHKKIKTDQDLDIQTSAPVLFKQIMSELERPASPLLSNAQHQAAVEKTHEIE